MDMRPEQLLELIIKAYEKGQKTAVSRLASELHDLKHDFYEYKVRTSVVLNDILSTLVELQRKLENGKVEEAVREVEDVISTVKSIKEEESNNTTHHEAPEVGEEGSPSYDPSLLDDRVLIDILASVILPENYRGRTPTESLRLLLYIYMKGGIVGLSEARRRFGVIAYRILSSVYLRDLVSLEGQGKYKILRLTPRGKELIEKVLSNYRRE